MQAVKFGLPFCSSVVTGRLRSPAETATLVVRADRVATGVRAVRRATVIANQAAEVAEPLAAAERPERLLTEQQVDATVRRARIGERRHDRRRPARVRAGRRRARRGEQLRRSAERVQDRHHPGRVARLQRRLGLDQARIDAGGERDRRRLAPEAVDLDHERAAVLRLRRCPCRSTPIL